MNSHPATTELAHVVEGMACGHCKVAVTERVSRVAGFSAVEADLDASLLRVRGSDVMSASTRRFARHYAEMVAAMVLGMVVLGTPATFALSAAGMSMSELHNDAPTLMLFGMAVTMTVPMVAWMRHRGHGWRASGEMSASMFIPAFGVIALLWGGLVQDIGALMLIEHVVMLPSMLVAMLLRGEEYSGGTHRHGQVRPVAA